MCPASKKCLYSIKRCLIRNDLIQIWKEIHRDIDVGLSDIYEYARNTRTRGRAYNFSYPLCQKRSEKRYFDVRCVNIWNSTSAEKNLVVSHSWRFTLYCKCVISFSNVYIIVYINSF